MSPTLFLFELLKMSKLTRGPLVLYHFPKYWSRKKTEANKSKLTRQSAQWGTYTPDQRYRHFLKSTKYVALTMEMAVVCYML